MKPTYPALSHILWADFTIFWNAYPNKQAKPVAWRAYLRARTRHPQEAILEGITAWQGSREWQDGYIPHPSTFLNQERFLDRPVLGRPQRPQDAAGDKATPQDLVWRANARETYLRGQGLWDEEYHGPLKEKWLRGET